MINLINNLLPILCLCMGFFVGYKMNTNNKELQVPEIVKHPKKHIEKKMKDSKEEKQRKQELEYLNKVLYNIEIFDGTSKGQISVRKEE